MHFHLSTNNQKLIKALPELPEAWQTRIEDLNGVKIKATPKLFSSTYILLRTKVVPQRRAMCYCEEGNPLVLDCLKYAALNVYAHCTGALVE